MDVTAKQVIDALRDEHMNVRSYSGRMMFGARCVGVDISGMGGLLDVAVALVKAGVDLDAIVDLGDSMQWDSMGREYVAYWPHLKLTAEERAALNDEDDEDDEDDEE